MFGFQPIPEGNGDGCLETLWTAAEYSSIWDGISDGATNVGDDNTDPSSFLYWTVCSEGEPSGGPTSGWHAGTAESLAIALGRPFSRGLDDPECCSGGG